MAFALEEGNHHAPETTALKASQTDDLAQIASLAKYTLGETTQLVTREAIQMFGGIGMTDEEEIGFFIKRAIVTEKTLGDHAYLSSESVCIPSGILGAIVHIRC